MSPGDDVAALLVDRLAAEGLRDEDVVVVAHKIVSKAEGRIVWLEDIRPSKEALRLAHERDPRLIEVILREAERVVRSRDDGFLITETRHGLVCAESGVDRSNAVAPGYATLLPLDPDRSAESIRNALEQAFSTRLAVIVSDSFARVGRRGSTDMAIGVSGLRPLLDFSGHRDAHGWQLEATRIAIADEIAGAAELVMGKLSDVPAAVVRGVTGLHGRGTAEELVMPRERDVFR